MLDKIFMDLGSNFVLRTAFISWLIAQLLKVLIHLLVEKKISMERLFGAGGMPSSHTSSVVALTFAVGFKEGLDSTIFAAVFIFAAIVIHDASRVRGSVGQHAQILNKINFEIFKDGRLQQERLKELIGHKPLEVTMGAILGVIVALVSFMGWPV